MLAVLVCAGVTPVQAEPVTATVAKAETPSSAQARSSDGVFESLRLYAPFAASSSMLRASRLRLSTPYPRPTMAAAVSEPAQASDQAAAGVDADEADVFVEGDVPDMPLDLRVPSFDAPALVAAIQRGAPVTTASAPETPAEGVFELPANVASVPTPSVESIRLFNPEYGLHGFMKQNWLSPSVALQGGLGLNDDRRINTEGDRTDDIAVGMGVILAF